MTWIIAILAFALSAWLTWRFTKPTSYFYIVDHPNQRSLHVKPTPRSGGVAIVTAIVVCCIFYLAWFRTMHDFISWAGTALLLVAVVSFFDDRRHIRVAYRLAAHVLGAVLLLIGGMSLRTIILPDSNWSLAPTLGVVISLLFIIWSINLYNFMDGMDGLAAGMATIGFGTLALFGWLAGNETYATLSIVVAAASAGFLCFNFPPAKIFMGDVGSSALGLLAALFSLWGVRDGIFPLWVPLLVFSPFIMDASVTLLRRLWRREAVWLAHKSHFYQQLVQAGWGHRNTALLEYVLMLASSVTAVWAIQASNKTQAVILGCWGMFYLVFFIWVSRITARRQAVSQGTRLP